MSRFATIPNYKIGVASRRPTRGRRPLADPCGFIFCNPAWQRSGIS